MFIQGQHSIELLRVALRCVFLTLRYTKMHSSSITEAKLIAVLQTIIEKDGVQDKLRLLALQTLRELAVGGYHTMLLDMSLLSRLLRFL